LQCGYLGVKREAIVEAAEHGNVELMELLIAHGALSDRWSFASYLPGRPILAACWVRTRPRTQDDQQTERTDCLAQAGKAEAVECLLRHNVLCMTSNNEFLERWGFSVNVEGVSPLCMAARRGHLDVVALLLTRLQDKLGDRYRTCGGAHHVPCLGVKAHARAGTGGGNSEQTNALLSASKDNRNDVIRHLLTHGVQTNLPCIAAYVKGGSSFDYDVFELLLQGTAFLLRDGDKADRSLIYLGVAQRALIESGICWSIFKSKRKMTSPIGSKLCELLLAKGADVNAPQWVAKWRADMTPLAHAGGPFILSQPTPQFKKLTPLPGTVAKGNTEVAEILLRYGASLSAAAGVTLPVV
jgi:hypothetical protein